MTLLVAGIDGRVVWMVADTAITNPLAPVQERLNRPKIIPARDSSLLGYADDADVGEREIFRVSTLPPGQAVIDALAHVQRSHGSVEFAYAYMDNGEPKLTKIANGEVLSVSALYLGDQHAFEEFQKIRHCAEVDAAPNALERVEMYLPQRQGQIGNVQVPQCLTTIIRAMSKVFGRNSDRHVGGVAVPFLLTPTSAQLVCYRMSVSDAIADSLPVGTLLPRGTSEGGGYDIELRDIAETNAFYTFIPQIPGGCLYARQSDGYAEKTCKAAWPEFEAWLTAETGKGIGHGWFAPHEPQKMTALLGMFDTTGKLVQGVASSGSVFSVSHLHNDSEPYRTAPDRMPPMDSIEAAPDGVSSEFDEAANVLNLKIDSTSLTLDASGVDQLIRHLGSARSRMAEPIGTEPHSGFHPFLIDPAWRTYPQVHPDFPGVGLGLRYPGLGWQMVLLPSQEAESLGASLSKGAKKDEPHIEAAPLSIGIVDKMRGKKPGTGKKQKKRR